MKFKPKGAINLTILVIHAQHGQYTMIKVRRNLNFSQPTKHKHVDLFHIHAQNWCLVIDEHGIPNESKQYTFTSREFSFDVLCRHTLM